MILPAHAHIYIMRTYTNEEERHNNDKKCDTTYENIIHKPSANVYKVNPVGRRIAYTSGRQRQIAYTDG
jgi:hypothetical protein